MKAYSEYWATTMIRGLLAIVAGTGVLFIPEMASTILLLPFAVVISILCLAAYGVIDSAMVLTTSFMIPRQQPGRLALRMQGVCGAVIGILLFVLVYDRVDLHWFLYLAAIQAAAAADHRVHRRQRNVGTPRCEVVLRLGDCCRDLRDRPSVWWKPESARTCMVDLWLSWSIRLQPIRSVRTDALCGTREPKYRACPN